MDHQILNASFNRGELFLFALKFNLFISDNTFLQSETQQTENQTILTGHTFQAQRIVVVDGSIYKKILGLLLIVPIIRFYFFGNAKVEEKKETNFSLSLVVGGCIGFLSGLIGIGGGILLSPILLLLKWTDQKQTAAISALFIFVNSLAGLSGQRVNGVQFSKEMMLFTLIAFAGGLAGAYFGALRFRTSLLRNILATVLLVAVFKLIFTQA